MNLKELGIHSSTGWSVSSFTNGDILFPITGPFRAGGSKAALDIKGPDNKTLSISAVGIGGGVGVGPKSMKLDGLTPVLEKGFESWMSITRGVVNYFATSQIPSITTRILGVNRQELCAEDLTGGCLYTQTLGGSVGAGIGASAGLVWFIDVSPYVFLGLLLAPAAPGFAAYLIANTKAVAFAAGLQMSSLTPEAGATHCVLAIKK